MALRFGQMLGGFAERGSQDIEEQRKDNQEMVNYAIQTWVTDGSDFLKTRTQKKKDTDALVAKLKNHFTPDQVGVILNQGDGERMIDHINVLSKQKSEIKPDELVSMADGYEKSGLTYAQIVERYMGKVNTGTDKDTAIVEALGPSSRYMQKKMKAAELAFGTSMQDLRALAQQDIVYESMPFEGTVSMTDPVAVARARAAVSGTGTTQGIRNNFTSFAGRLFGGERTQTTDPITGQMVYRTTFKRDEDEIQAQLFADRANVYYADLLATNAPDKAIELTRQWMVNNQPEEYKKTTGGGSGTGGTGAPSTAQQNVNRLLNLVNNANYKNLQANQQQNLLTQLRQAYLQVGKTQSEIDKLLEPYER